MPVNFTGKWTLDGTENYEKFLIDMKVPEALHAALASASDLEIVHEGNTVKYRRERGDDIFEIAIVIGEEYTESTYGYTEVRVCNWEGDKLVVKAAEGGGHWTSSIEIVDGQIVATEISAGGVTAKRWFNKA